MPTERDDALQPKLEVVRLEDRLTPVAAPTTDALLSFAPNPSLDFGTTMPVAPTGGVSTTTAAAATTATSPLLAPNQYQLVLPATGDATTADSSGGSFALFSVVPPPPSANLSGFVYVDEGANGGVRDDGIKQAGEPGIQGTTLTLLRVINGVTLTAGSTTTDANGFYQFTSLSPLGEYRVVETQPSLFVDGKDTAGTVNGSTRGTAGNDIISGITLNGGENGVNYNFGELAPPVPPAPARLSGFVYVDEGANGGTRDDGIKQAGEPGIPGTTITLFRVVSGVTSSVSQTTTDANGFYDFGQLQPGTYEVRQAQPTGFNDGKDTPGSTGGTAPQNDRLISIPLAAGQNSQNNNFGELFERGALSGFVYVDEGANGGTRDDGIRQPGETPIPGTTVTLFRVLNGQTTSVSQTTTDANGFYRFANLPAGNGYIVRETQPTGFNDGKDTPGSTGGANSANDELSGIDVPANGESFNNNFGELAVPPQPGALSGFVYVDEGANGGVRDDGQKQGGEPGIQGTTVTLFRVVNGVTSSVSQTTTDANGFYRFANLTPGEGYIVRETQPAGFNDGKDTPGSTGGTNSVNDELSAIRVPVNGESVNNNFGELRQTGALSGFVYVDEGANGGTRDDGIRQPGETPIPGTTVTLFRVLNGQTTSVSQTTTDANGFYRFANLTPGEGYIVRETQPATFADGKDTPGSTGGANSANDELSGINVPANGESFNNNFGELIPVIPPARLSGFVYEDPNNNGQKEPGEAPIPGTTVTLFRVLNGQTTSLSQTTTNANGFYQFTNLAPGTYEVRETQPTGFLDGKDTAGSTGGTVTNDRISTIVLASNDDSVNNNFGELRPARLSGFEYVDEGANGGTRDDGIKQPGEPGIPGTTIVLTGTDDLGGVTRTATTGADGSYAFDNLRPGSYSVNASQPTGFNDGKDTAGSKGGTVSNDRIDAIPIVAGDNSVNNNFGELLQIGSLSGFVYEDSNDNGQKEAGETPIPGTTVTLFRVVNGQTTSLSQTTTDANGFYRFTNLTPGEGYLVRETQPAGFNDGKDTPGSTGGTNSANDELSAIRVPANGASINNNFGELRQTGSLSGFVYVDEGANGGTRDDGQKQPGETPIQGVTITLFRVVNGQTTSLSQTTTDANGFYRFTNLTPGEGYLVRETQPAGFNDGKDTPGSTGGTNSANDELSAIRVPVNGESVNNNFGELFPPRPARLSGFVYEDRNDNGLKDPGEAGIPGVTLSILGTLPDGTPLPPARTTTDANGFYDFGELPAGTYRVFEEQPVDYLDGKDTPGSTGGSNPTNDELAGIPLRAGDNSQNNNFGERLGSLSGFVYVDEGANGGTRDDGIKQSGEPGIPGVPVRLLRNGVVQQTVTTGADGSYRFENLRLGGGYTVEEVTQPAGFADGKDTAGTPGAGIAGNEVISNITLTQTNPNSPNNNFGELLLPGSLSGFVYVDEGANGGTRDDGIRQPGETPIPGTTVTLFRVLNGQTTSLSQTTTDANGFYQFTNLTPGEGYLVRETQPAGFNDGKDTPGSTGGTNSANDELSAIRVPANGTSINNNFGELTQPARLSGFVYEDRNDNGVKDPGEPGIPGVVVRVGGVRLDGTPTGLFATTTDANGFYEFPSLPAGTYGVQEVQPAGFLDGKDTPGSTGGGAPQNDTLTAVPLAPGANSINNNFGELRPVPPPPVPAQLSGFVYIDADDDGVYDNSETPIPGATITLFRVVNGQTTSLSQTTTNFNGAYEFIDLEPGTYVVREAQPINFLDGKDTAGSKGGTVTNDQIAGIVLSPGDISINNNFGELTQPARLSGFVYEDRNDNGVKDPGEPGIPGVVVRVGGVRLDGTPTGLFATTTDANGFYEFPSLPAGTYGVQEVQPAGFLDGKDTPGSTGGGAPQNDTLTAVPLAPGANSINNNFGELVPVIPPPPVPGTVSGFVYEDPNDNGVKEPGEPGIPGVVVRLSNGAITTTDANGFYQFSNLVPGLYTITQSQPAGFIDGKDTAGTTGGTAGNDVINLLTVQPGGASLNNNFGELRPVSLYGYVWHDINRNSQFDPSEQGLGGATVTLTGTTLGGRPVTTDLTGAPLVAVTDANGRYSFANLPPGTYSVVQTNTPAGFTDFASQNAARLTVTASSNTSFGGVGLNRDAGPLNFGKVQPGVIVDPPTPNPQQPGVVSKQNFLGSTPGGTVTVPPSTPGQQLPTAPGSINPSVLGPTGSGTAGRRIYAVGSGAGTPSTVRVLDAATGGELYRFQPFESTFLGGVTTAVGDVTGDGVDDIAVGAGAGGGPRVRVYDGRSGAIVRDFFAYDPTFIGGVFLASGDVDGDGAADLITGAGAGGGPHVRVFSGRTGGELASFFAFDPSFTGGVRVAAGNFLGNGRAQVGTSTGSGAAGQVVVYDIAARTPTNVGRFQPFEGFTGGVNLAMGDVDGDGRAEVIAGAGAGGGPRVRAINFAGGTVADFFAAAPTFAGGVTVAARDLNADGRADIVVGLGAGGQSRLQVFSGVNLAPLDSFFAFDSNNTNGIFVG